MGRHRLAARCDLAFPPARQVIHSLVLTHAHIPLSPPTANGLANVYTIGRGRSCDIRLEDARISATHCRIYCQETPEAGGRLVRRVYVEDMSSNGTFVNGTVKLARVRVRTHGIAAAYTHAHAQARRQ